MPYPQNVIMEMKFRSRVSKYIAHGALMFFAATCLPGRISHAIETRSGKTPFARISRENALASIGQYRSYIQGSLDVNISALSPLVGYVAQLPANSPVMDADPAVLELRDIVAKSVDLLRIGDDPSLEHEYAKQMSLYFELESAFPGLLGEDLTKRVVEEHRRTLDKHEERFNVEVAKAVAAWREGSPWAESGDDVGSTGAIPGHRSEKIDMGLKPSSRGPQATHLITTLESMGFQKVDDHRFEHPSGIIVTDARRGELSQGTSGGFTFRQKTWGELSILDPQWIAGQNVPMILDHLDEIMKRDFEPAIVLDFRRPPNDVRRTISHEGVHFSDSLTPAGRRRFAVKIANATLNPLWLAHSLAYDIFTEMRAYAVDGHPGVAPVVDQVQAALDSSDESRLKEIFPTLVINATAFVAQLFPAVAGQYLDPETGHPIEVTQADQEKAGRHLADLIRRHGLKSRIPIQREE